MAFTLMQSVSFAKKSLPSKWNHGIPLETRSDVILLQQELNETLSRNNQKFVNLEEDGIIGPNTLNAIKEFKSRFPTQEGESHNQALARLVSYRKNDENFAEKRGLPADFLDSNRKLNCSINGCEGRGKGTRFTDRTLSCGKKGDPFNECYGAISINASKQLCKGKDPCCYQGLKAKVSANGKTIEVPIRDIGGKFNGNFAPGVQIDLTPKCIVQSGFGGSCKGEKNKSGKTIQDTISCYGLKVTLGPGNNGNVQVADKK